MSGVEHETIGFDQDHVQHDAGAPPSIATVKDKHKANPHPELKSGMSITSIL